MNITSNLFEAYLKCPTKCFLRSRGEAGAGNEYANWVRVQTELYRNDRITRLENHRCPRWTDHHCCPDRSPKGDRDGNTCSILSQKHQILNLTSTSSNERRPKTQTSRLKFVPTRFIYTNKTNKHRQTIAGVRCAHVVRSTRTRGAVQEGSSTATTIRHSR